MQIGENYDLPFETEFDWRVTMFRLMQDFIRDSLIEVIEKYKESDADFEWKDDENILAFAQENNLFDKANKLAKEKVEKWFKDMYS